MPQTTDGLALLAAAITAHIATPYLAVSDGTTPFSSAWTDLPGANQTRKSMDLGYPQVSGPTVTYRSTFGGAEANHAWETWGVAVGPAAGSDDIYSAKVETLTAGKASGSTFELTVVHTYG